MLLAFSVLPQPLTPATLLAVKHASRWSVALAAAAAAAVAATVDHIFVRRVFSLNKLAEIRENKLFHRAEGWEKVAPFLTTTSFAAFPLPFLIVRVLLPLILPAAYVGFIELSAALWFAAFAVFTVVYYPILSRPRLDGQEG